MHILELKKNTLAASTSGINKEINYNLAWGLSKDLSVSLVFNKMYITVYKDKVGSGLFICE